jgi:hypothetical protein
MIHNFRGGPVRAIRFALPLLAAFALPAQEVPPPWPQMPATVAPQTAPVPSDPDDDQRPGGPMTRPSLPQVPAPGGPLSAPLAAQPQTFSQRFVDYAVVTVGPRALVTPVIPSAIRMAIPPSSYPRDWTNGAGAFGRNYGNFVARNASLRTARFLAGSLLHEDFRYRPSGSKNPIVRCFHAIEFTFVDRSDSGHSRPAFANFAAATAGGFVGRLYLPAGYNDLSHAETQAGILFGQFAAQNLLREFAPEIVKATRKLHIPFPRIPVPEWWTPR